MSEAPLIANARMYAATTAAREAWSELFAWVERASGVALRVVAHAAPAPLEELWRRGDLGLAFMCGYPFARADFDVQAVAAPIPAPARYGGRATYATDLVTRADAPFHALSDAFGGRIGWTVAHSQSGFNAVRHHLLAYRSADRPQLFAASVGPLVTPRRVVEAVLAGEIDVGPLDSYAHDLLAAHEPGTAARLRILATTAWTPAPLLVASAGVDPAVVGSLRASLLAAASDRTIAPAMARLRLAGFAMVEAESYAPLLAQAKAANDASYPAPM